MENEFQLNIARIEDYFIVPKKKRRLIYGNDLITTFCRLPNM